jgi:preprotein translocase subunit SecA
MTLATITFQNYFRMYDKLAGMTGTAMTEAEELHKIYTLDVTAIPTHRDVIREDRSDLVYKTKDAKWNAVVEEIAERHEAGQPVLVGTVSVENSEMLSRKLARRGVDHEVLNAKNHEREAEIIAQAGRVRQVTIATNMAGRGVDILLGGNAEGTARQELRKHGFDLTTVGALEWDDAVTMLRAGEDPHTRHQGEWVDALHRAWAQTASERGQILELGGLYVLGTERHEARRIDNQLRGRAGRQGDPGESRFFVALEDELMLRFGGERVKNLMDSLGVEDDVPIESGLVSRQIEGAQVKVEGYNFDLRKHLLEYDEVINEQRKVIYEQRTTVLQHDDLRPAVWEMVAEEVAGLVPAYTAASERQDWDMLGLAHAAHAIFQLPEGTDPEEWRQWTPDEIAEHLTALAEETFEAKRERLGDETMHQLERAVMLRAIDTWWIRHLTALDELRTGIGLRAFGQQDPLVTFKREGYAMFQSLLTNIQEEIVRGIFYAELTTNEPAPPRTMQRARASRGPELDAQAQAAARPDTVTVGVKIGRNDPCWCGSGKKYKLCHMKQDEKNGGPPPAAVAQAGRQRARR